MRNYILADLKRITQRIPRLIAMTGIFAILVIIIVRTYIKDWNSINFTTNVEAYTRILTILLGFIEIVSVFADDFKAKTMQVAIGIGISRKKVILSKLLEVIILVFFDLVLFGVIAFSLGGILGAGLNIEQVKEILAFILSVWYSIVGYTSLTMILMFFTQNSSIGSLTYLGICITVFAAIPDLIFSLPVLAKFNLDHYLLSSLVKTFQSHILMGRVNAGALIGILLYIIVGYLCTVWVFKKRELEF